MRHVRPKLSLFTLLMLTFVAAMLIKLNLQPTEFQREVQAYGAGSIYRGWPFVWKISPFG